ncbi:MAG: PhoX family protein [Ostreibacterium sp.]
MDNTRRQLLIKGSTLSGIAFLGGIPTLGMTQSLLDSKKSSPLLGFKAIPTSTQDSINIAEGYRANVLLSWGDKLFPYTAEFKADGSNTSSEQAQQYGDNNDGMSFFQLSENRGLLAINHEYPNQRYLFSHQNLMPQSLEDVLKSQSSIGISVVELVKKGQQWVPNIDSAYNRRITANTPTSIQGPARGHEKLKTDADPKGETVLGTLGNCSNGKTPWGTYLTCEENFDDMFGFSDKESAAINEEMALYGASQSGHYGWEKFDDRFQLNKNPNEFNRFGWIVEIDPMNPQSTPIKRTALGRFKHENVAIHISSTGHVVAYMGDDERGEHIYKFVSRDVYQENSPEKNRDLLNEGTLYVSKFEGSDKPEVGTGKWIPLVYGKNGLDENNGFHSQADVVILTRKAARIVGATTMDRPEWIAINPKNGTICCTLTNNSKRGSDKMPVNAANPRKKNQYGHIIRWQEANNDHTALNFTWDIYVMAGNPNVYPKGSPYAGSGNINKDNTFNSPDGLGFDDSGRIWIETDGKYSNKEDYLGQGNNMMLAGDPNTGEIKRFLTGPKSCEITGLTFSDDYRSMFINIQHPGENEDSTFPNNSLRPRSSLVQITKEDGGIIGT